MGVVFLRSLFHSSTTLFSGTKFPGSSEASERVKRLADEISLLNLLEVNDLLKLLQVCYCYLNMFLVIATYIYSFVIQVKLGLPDLSSMGSMSQSSNSSAAPVKAAAAGNLMLNISTNYRVNHWRTDIICLYLFFTFF